MVLYTLEKNGIKLSKTLYTINAIEQIIISEINAECPDICKFSSFKEQKKIQFHYEDKIYIIYKMENYSCKHDNDNYIVFRYERINENGDYMNGMHWIARKTDLGSTIFKEG